MSIGAIIVVFVIMWWVVFFMALPIGIKAGEAKDGNFNGAPVNPNIKIKAVVTTLITAVLTAVYYWADANFFLY